MMDDPPDRVLLFEMADSNTRETSVDLQSLNQYRRADKLERWHVLDDSIVGHLVQDHGVLGLILDLAL
jgi:hypothetical protein